jgi:hypothetical protein
MRLLGRAFGWWPSIDLQEPGKHVTLSRKQMTEPALGPFRPPRFFHKYPGFTLAILVILLAVGLDFLGGLIYSLALEVKHREAASDSGKEQLVDHNPYFHHGLVPNKSVEGISWGNRRYSIYTNSLGLRDSSIRNVDPVSDRCRILFMGDSFTFAVGVDYQESFVGMIQNRLASRGVDVLNAGAESYSPVIYYRKIKDLILRQRLRFDELIVFLDISDPEDEAYFYKIDENDNVVSRDAKWLAEAQLEEGGPQSVARRIVGFVRDHTLLFRYAWINIRLSYALPLTNLKRSLWTVDEALYNEYGEIGLHKMKESMDSLRELLAEHGIALAIAVYPWPDQIVHRDLNSIQVRFWQKWAQENGVGFFNLFPAFIDSRGPEYSLHKNYIKGDVHWNEAGHRLVTEKFFDFYCLQSNYAAPCRARICDGGERHKR